MRKSKRFNLNAALSLVASLIVLTGCTSSANQSCGPEVSQPTHWTMVAPKGAQELPQVKALLAERRKSFTVRVLEFDPNKGTSESRLNEVWQQISTDSVSGNACQHLLIIGSPRALSMGPWTFEGVSEPITSDWLLTTKLGIPATSVPLKDWQGALQVPALRTVGRIPFDDFAVIAITAQLTLDHDARANNPRPMVLLGASSTASAWPLARARQQMQDAGVNASLRGDGGSCNFAADTFLPAWQTTDGQGVPTLVCVAGSLPPLLLGEATPTQELRQTAPASILIAFAPKFARPESPDLLSLISGKQASAIAGFTANISASPLTPALQTMVDVPVHLARGVELGMVIEGMRRQYWLRAGEDIGRWIPGVQENRAQLAMSAVLYGDPAMRAAPDPSGRRTPPEQQISTDTAAVSIDTPIEKDPPSTAPARFSTGFKALAFGLLAAAIALLFFFFSGRRNNG